jgi:RNA polymerase sigma-70 factor (ECF subfamily)
VPPVSRPHVVATSPVVVLSPPGDQLRAAHLPDAQLARQASNGDRAAMEVLIRRHQVAVYRICRRLCVHEADALDAMQQALITVARRIGRFDGRSSFTTWLYRVTTNACLDELRRRRRRPPLLRHEPGDDRPPASRRARGAEEVGQPAEADVAERTARRLALDEALSSLPPEFRAPVVLRDVAGLDYAEISDVLEIPAGTVRSRISRGRAQLARYLRAHDEDGPPPPPASRVPTANRVSTGSRRENEIRQEAGNPQEAGNRQPTANRQEAGNRRPSGERPTPGPRGAGASPAPREEPESRPAASSSSSASEPRP